MASTLRKRSSGVCSELFVKKQKRHFALNKTVYELLRPGYNLFAAIDHTVHV